MVESTLIPLAAAVIGVVRDYDPQDTGALLDHEGITDEKSRALIVALAAMVDADASPSELLAWTATPVQSRTFTPAAYDIKNLNEHAFGRRAERRAEIIRLTNEGLTRPQIAARMGITVRCVERHRAAIRAAMEAAS